MLSHWPIRYKLLFGTVVLCLIIGFLAFSSFRGVYAYRELVRGISQRALELEPASELLVKVSKLKTGAPQNQLGVCLRHASGIRHVAGRGAVGALELPTGPGVRRLDNLVHQ